MPTIADVARKAGVSVATVSRVINGTKFVSPELRQCVLQAMEELDYHPNLLAGSLRRGKSYTIGLIVPDTANPFFGEVAKAVEDVGFQNGYNVVLCNSNYDLERERSYIEVLLAKQVDGLVFIPCSSEIAHVRDLLAKMRGPVVIADRYTPELSTDSVTAANRVGGRLVAQHLLTLGHQRIGWIGRPEYLVHVQDRFIGFRETLAEQGVIVPDELCVRGGFSLEDGLRAARRLLSGPNPPTAIFAYNDIMAIGALRAAREMGLHVPDDVAIVGFDNIPQASFVTPQLTTVDHPKYHIGELATQLLIGRLRGEIEGDPQQHVLDVRLVVRESSDPTCRVGPFAYKPDQ